MGRFWSRIGNWTLEDVGLKAPFQSKAGILLDLDCSEVGGKILARGKAKGQVILSCTRCLEDFKKSVETGFFFEFEEAHQDAPGEAADDDPNVAYFNEQDLPLREELRQELELCLPVSAVCDKNCKGLCIKCGNNLNKMACSCEDAGISRPLQGLRNLLNKDN